MHCGKVLFHDKISGTVGDCSKSEGRFRGERVRESGVLNSREIKELLSGDHEGCQVGRVDGEEDDREESPDTRHEPGREAPGTVHLHRGLEEDSPDQPVGSEEGELVVLVAGRDGLGREVLVGRCEGPETR